MLGFEEASLKVLIAEFDLFSKTGGGQTVYRGLIETNPTIDFFYLVRDELAEVDHPSNAYPILYKESYTPQNLSSFYDITPPRWAYPPFLLASNIAASAAGHRFDIVDLPDYEQFALFIRPALTYHGVEFDRIALSLHGRISTSIRLNWMTEGKIDRALEQQEELQYLAADSRYGISRSYLEEWAATTGVDGHYMNPLRFLRFPDPQATDASHKPPDLYFIGRTEKRKGPDIFIELAWWLPGSRFGNAHIVGDQSFDPNHIGSSFYLYRMAQNRIRDIQITPAADHSALKEIFDSRSLTILPSRYDTLNLVALESLLSGCPTAIGSGAGVIRFLRESFPQVPFVEIDLGNIYASLPDLVSILREYDGYRAGLVDALKKSHPVIDGDDIREIYSSNPLGDNFIRTQLQQWYENLMAFHRNASRSPIRRAQVATLRFVKGNVSQEFRKQLRASLASLSPGTIKSNLKSRLQAVAFGFPFQVADQARRAQYLQARYRHLFYLPEHSKSDLKHKVQACWDIASDMRIDRVRIWREIARLEQLRENDLVAATYELRVVRALGEDRFGMIPSISQTLRARDFDREAQVAEAMYGFQEESSARCSIILDEALAANRRPPGGRFEIVDDRRKKSAARVSVIVSLYEATSRVPSFLRALSNQTLIASQDAEVILVDTGSSDDQYTTFRQVMEHLELPVVYARRKNRETIQSAWNRGIELSNAPYLTFLGVDEGILPSTLEVLAGELDEDPSLDWVQANSLVTSVDTGGQWLGDIMQYDRNGYTQDHVYLETCYLSWVGAMYRRSVHDRFGYYDPSFRAAGDTEFKNRVLPFIKTKAIPATLGVFWNYPEERTTQSPVAEIEDLRAWYLHRTVSGVRYAFSKRDPHDAEHLLLSSLRYRKSYCQHWSTDLEYANNIVQFIRNEIPDSSVLSLEEGIRYVLQKYSQLDWLQRLEPRRAMLAVLNGYVGVTRMGKRQHRLTNGIVQPEYHFLNDNRYEQHSNVWSTGN